MISECGPKKIKKIRVWQGNKNRRETFDPEGQGEISVFPLTKLIMDVPIYSVGLNDLLCGIYNLTP